jgi:DNA-binding NarL/FixJ family response regulator
MLTDFPKLKLVIVEDESAWLGKIEKILKDHFSDKLVIVGKASFIPTAIETIKKANPDIVILDLKIGNRWSWDILEEFISPDFFIVFISSYPIHEARCILQRSCLGFIDKEQLTEKNLQLHINLALNMNAKIQYEKYRTLRRILNNEDIITVESTSRNLEIIFREEIIYAEVKNRIITYHTVKKLIRTASSIEEILPALNSMPETGGFSNTDIRFFRIHRNTIINLKYLESIEKDYVVLSGPGVSSISVDISRNCKIKLIEFEKNRK